MKQVCIFGDAASFAVGLFATQQDFLLPSIQEIPLATYLHALQRPRHATSPEEGARGKAPPGGATELLLQAQDSRMAAGQQALGVLGKL